MICSVAVLSMTLVTKLAAANEVEGFRLGMSMQQVSQLVLEKGYKLSNPVKSGQNWTSYLLMKDGPNLSFLRQRPQFGRQIIRKQSARVCQLADAVEVVTRGA